jgi:D-alanyl-D-alanine dipeptidase
MTFTTSIQKLRETPIPVDTWKDSQVGEANDGPYKQNYPNITVDDKTNDALIDVSAYGLVNSDFYLDQLLRGDHYLKSAFDNRYLWSRALARRSHARRLAKVDTYLRQNGLFLFVASAWRHPDLQEIVTKQFAEQFGDEEARRMFAPVAANRAPPPHATGAAFDLEIWSLDSGCRLEMYYRMGDRNIYNAYALERMAVDNALARDATFLTSLMNRRILFHVMCTLNVVFTDEADLFCNHPGEFWHFGEGDPLSAYLSRQPNARYGAIYPSQGA